MHFLTKMGRFRVDIQSIGLCLQNITNPKKVARHSIDQKMAWMACSIMYFLIHQKPFENNCFRVVKTAKTLTVIKRKICWLRIHKFYELRPSFTLCYLRRSNSTKLFNNLESLKYFGNFWRENSQLIFWTDVFQKGILHL